ncbi:MAG: TetR/AcrR family transcriptional regulator C-terminal domain-containing protein [Clostridia bacterium]
MEDLRTKRTYKLLKDALFELLTKQSFDSIKVSDICDLAMVHRTTFYTHFSDKYELLEYCIREIEQEIILNMKDNNYTNRREFYTNMIMNVLTYISGNKKFFKLLLKKNEETNFFNIFTNSCISCIHEMLEEEELSGIKHYMSIEVISNFYSGAVISTIVWWLKTNSKLNEKELCENLITLIFDNPHD